MVGLIAGLGQTTLAQDLPVYEAGQAFVFTNGRVEQVNAINGDAIEWRSRSGSTYTKTINPVVPTLSWTFRGRKGERRISGNPDRLFPLNRGRAARFRVTTTRTDTDGRASRSVQLWTCRVEALTRVNTPAGTFDAFPLACDRFSPNTMRLLSRRTWFYAPDVNHYVRRTTQNMRTGETSSYDLAFAVPPADANPIRLDALSRQARALDE